MNPPTATNHTTAPLFLSDSSEMKQRIQNFNWAQTSLGSIEGWPQSLRTTLSIILNSRFPMFLFWGPEHLCFYNDAYRPSLGKEGEGKHPWALGQKGVDVWPEIWDIIFPQIDSVMKGGAATWHEDHLVPIYRNGKVEEVYWTYSYSPVMDEQGDVAGVFVTCTETTEKVQNVIKIERSENQYKQVINHAPVIIWAVDTNGVFTVSEGAALHNIGLASGELVGKSHFELYKNYPEAIAPIKQALQGETVTDVVEIEGRVYQTQYNPIKGDDGTVTGMVAVSTDVTEQAKAQEALKESEARFRNILDQTPEPMLVLKGEDMVVEVANEPLFHTWRTDKSVIGKPLLECLPEIKGQGVIEMMLDVYRNKKIIKGYDRPVVYDRGNGETETLYYNFIYSPYEEANGEVTGVLVIGTDVTGSVLARQKLEESENRYRQLFDTTPIAITEEDHTAFYEKVVSLQQQGITDYAAYFATRKDELYEMLGGVKIVGVNQGQLDLTGTKDVEEFIANRARFFVGMTEQTVYQLMDLLRSGGGAFREETVIKNMKGELRNVWVSLNYPPTPPYSSIAITLLDVTERKQAESSLAYQKQVLETVTENTDLALFLMDEHQYCVYMNEAAEQMTGFTLEELKGKQLHYHIHHTHPDGSPFPLEECPIDQALPTKKRMKGEEVFVHKDGRFYTVAFTASPIIVDGKATGTVIEVRETTEEKKQQQALIESESRYRHLIQANIVGILFWDLDGGIVDANDELLNMLGYERADLEKGLDWRTITPDKWRDADVEGERQVLETGQHKPFEKQYLHKDGHPVDVIIASSAFENTRNRRGVTFVVDISERKKAEAALMESETLFRSFSNNIQNLAWIADGEGWIWWYNQRWYDYTGTTLDEMQGWGWQKVHHPDHIERVLAFVKEAWRKPEPFELTFPLRGADGLYRWFLTRAVPVVNAEGKIERWIGTNTNVHEQRLAEEKIRESETQFRTLIQEAPVATCLFVGRELKIEIANEKIIAIMGKGASVVGKPLAEAVPELEGQPFLVELDKVFTTGETFENRNARAELLVGGERKVFYFDYIFKPLRNASGEVYAILDMTIDVTSHVLARQQLQQSEERFRTLATTIPQIVWMNDALGNLEYITQNWMDYTGQDLEEAKRNAAELIHPDDRPAVWKAWEVSFASGIEWKQEYRLKNSTGDYRWFSAVMSPLKNESGEILKWIGAATDIHEQKQFSERLEQVVAKRTHELQRSNEDLQQFAHVASHDLKEPVRKVKTFAGRLEQHLNGVLDEAGSQFLEKIHSAANRMFSMIDGVLNYSTINASTQSPQPVDLNDVIKNIETDLEVIIQKTGAQLTYAGLPTIEGAPVLLYQLFYNLINNSIKFAKAGVPPQITISSQAVSGVLPMVRIVLSDNGIGFEQEQAAKIFDTFTRLNPKDKYEGTGLGLALCKKIVERHSGIITASGVHGEGAMFIILLPVQQKEESI
jgi:PAS domain S-box-containing protein